MSSIAVIMVGGPTTSNFRALGSVPAPLFPIAGRALLHHPITAAAAVPGITAVFVLGFYEEREFAPYLATMSAEVGVPVRYLCESRGHGSAGGLHQFRDTLLQENPGNIFLLNCDVCCAFPLVGACTAAPRGFATRAVRSHAAPAPMRPGAAPTRGACCAAACGSADRDRGWPCDPPRRHSTSARCVAHARPRVPREPSPTVAPCTRWALGAAAALRRLTAATRGVACASSAPCRSLTCVPPAELLAAHTSHPSALGTMLVKRVPEAKARECGEVVADDATCELLHYIERPETCVTILLAASAACT